MRTLPREPWRDSMICGWQIGYGLPHSIFCGERKGDDLPLCEEHWYELIESGESTAFPSNVTLGAPCRALRLLWESEDPETPLEASYDEMARYAGTSSLGGE